MKDFINSKLLRTESYLEAISGLNGSRYISGTAEITAHTSFAFEAWTDTVISSLKDPSGAEHISSSSFAGVTIPKGSVVFFGFPVAKITLASGTGQLFLC